MRRLKLRKVAFTIMILITFCTIVLTNRIYATSYTVFEVEEQTDWVYVNDFADVFTTEEKNDMVKKSKSLNDRLDGVQVVVTTIKSLNGNKIEDYAYSMFNQYGIGKNAMGILILIAPNDNSIYIETGYRMKDYITDEVLDDILKKYPIDYSNSKDIAQKVKEIHGKVITEVEKELDNSDETTNQAQEEKKDVEEKENPVGSVIVGIIVIVLFILAIAAMIV